MLNSSFLICLEENQELHYEFMTIFLYGHDEIIGNLKINKLVSKHKGKFPCIDVKWGAKVEPKYLKKRIIENQQNIRLRSLVITHVSM
jgi:hypothetical protein